MEILEIVQYIHKCTFLFSYTNPLYQKSIFHNRSNSGCIKAALNVCSLGCFLTHVNKLFRLLKINMLCLVKFVSYVYVLCLSFHVISRHVMSVYLCHFISSQVPVFHVMSRFPFPVLFCTYLLSLISGPVTSSLCVFSRPRQRLPRP